MSDLYSEIMIQRLPNPRDKFKGLALALLMAACIVGYITVSWLFLFGIVGTGIAMYIIIPKFNVEYEYLLVNNYLDVDAIYSRKKRKKLASFDLNTMELLAPYQSHRMDFCKSNTRMRMQNYSAMDRNDPPYAMIISESDGPVMVLLQFNRETVENMRQFHPSKVFLD